jgi:prolipoprotein diacylglyceryl transferase
MSTFHWGIDPVLFHLGPLQIRWYGLLFVGGLFLGLEVLRWIYRREGRDPRILDSLLIYMIVGIVVGARLAHTLIYEPDYFLAHPVEILYVWHGGLASHGGMLGAIVAAWLFCRKHHESLLWLLSRLTIPGTLVAASVRIGNFFNSEILGLPTQVPWAVVFTRVDTLPRHPVQLYEAAGYLLTFLVLLAIYLRVRPETATRILPGTFLILLFGIRFVLEYFKTEQADYVTGLPFTVGQLLSLPLIFLGVFWLLYSLRRLRRP